MEERKINYPKNRKMKKNLIRKGALGLAMALTLSVTPAPKNMVENVTTVEAAKKDKKKPKITLKGQKTLTVEEGEKVTIPKTTYSDNKTKKKKLKVGVTVKRGKKNYKTIATKIKKATLKSKPVAVEFPEDGTYKITTTVTDLAKNKATAVRTVVVNEKDIVIDDQQIDVKEDPITEEPTRKVVTPETPTTTEEPKKEENKKISTDLSKYGDIKKVVINGNEYKVIEDKQVTGYKFDNDAEYEISNISKDFSKNYNAIIGNNSSITNEKYLPLYFFGKISATKGEYDYSNNIFITLYKEKLTSYDCIEADVLYEDENNNLICISYNRFYVGNYKDLINDYEDLCPGVDWNNTYFYDDEDEFRIIPSPSENEYKIGEKTLKLVPKSKE